MLQRFTLRSSAPAILSAIIGGAVVLELLYTFCLHLLFGIRSWLDLPELLETILLSSLLAALCLSLVRRSLRLEHTLQAQQNLQRETRFFNLISERMNDVFWVLDLTSGRFVYVSPTVLNLRGYSAEEVMAQSMEAALIPESAEYLGKVIPERLAHLPLDPAHNSFRDEIGQPCRDGSVVWTEVNTQFLINPETGHMEVIGVTRDISERRKALEAVRETAELYQKIISATKAVAYQRNYKTESYDFMTDGIVELTGYTKDELTTKQWREMTRQIIMRGALAQYPVREAMRLVAEGKILSWHADTNIVTKSGQSKWLSDISVQITADDGSTAGSLGIMQDITERVNTEAALLQAQKIKSIGILAGGIAHDFNNLLNAIIGNVEIARMKLSDEAAVRAHLDKVIATADRAADLTRQLLAYAGKGKFNVHTLDINALIRETHQILEVTMPKNVSLEMSLGEGGLSVNGDRGQIHQILMNLLMNGAEAIGSEQGTVTITTGLVHCDREQWILTPHQYGAPLFPGDYVRIDIADTGVGMDDATIGKIFDPFFTTKFTGRGLGLAAVLGIATGHDAAITVESTPGSGTVFSILLPRTLKIVVEALEQSADIPSILPRGKKILVADDEAIVLETVVDILSSAGLSCLAAHDGKEAFELFQSCRDEIGFVILDISMPHMGGDEVLKKILEIVPNIPALFTSGYAEESLSPHPYHGKPIPFVQKPYRAQELLKKIEAGLSHTTE